MSKQTYPDKPELTKGFGKCVLSRCYRLRLDSSGDGVLEAAEVGAFACSLFMAAFNAKKEERMPRQLNSCRCRR